MLAGDVDCEADSASLALFSFFFVRVCENSQLEFSFTLNKLISLAPFKMRQRFRCGFSSPSGCATFNSYNSNGLSQSLPRLTHILYLGPVVAAPRYATQIKHEKLLQQLTTIGTADRVRPITEAAAAAAHSERAPVRQGAGCRLAGMEEAK